MRERLLNTWDILRSGLWFIPSVLTVLGGVLSFIMLSIDARFGGNLPRWLHWVYGGDAAGARSVLAAIGTSVATVAGVVFSISIVVTTLVSQQFGPRVVREFLRDLMNQVVLGTFVGTFVYTLLVLRKVREGQYPFIPQLSVTMAIALAVLTLIVLIVFLHHQSSLTRASTIVPRLADHLNNQIRQHFKTDLPRSDLSQQAKELDFGGRGQAVIAIATGYVQVVDTMAVYQFACENDLAIRINVRAGMFVTCGDSLVQVAGAKKLQDLQDLKDKTKHAVREAVTIGAERTQSQDLEFAVEQMLQIALRALSPALNDPMTADICIDYLAATLLQFIEVEPDSRVLGEKGRVRVLLCEQSFASFADAILDPLRPHAAEQVGVTIRLLERLRTVAERTRSQDQKRALAAQIEALIQAAERRPLEAKDQRDLRRRYDAAMAPLRIDSLAA